MIVSFSSRKISQFKKLYQNSNLHGAWCAPECQNYFFQHRETKKTQDLAHLLVTKRVGNFHCNFQELFSVIFTFWMVQSSIILITHVAAKRNPAIEVLFYALVTQTIIFHFHVNDPVTNCTLKWSQRPSFHTAMHEHSPFLYCFSTNCNCCRWRFTCFS